MARHKIVFADNNLDFLRTRKEFLEQKSLEVIEATTPAEARIALAGVDIDLAIIDIRLSDDDDDKDISGLQLAADPAFVSIPKIILTAYPIWEHVPEAFISHQGELPRVAEFVAKQEGPGALLVAIGRILSLKESLRFRQSADILQPKRHTPADNCKIFIIHGHDISARETVARFVDRLGLEAVILGEKPGEGLSILQMLEKHCEVGFAIAILTPDDFGGAKKKPNLVNERARQNVIFELGYFIGRLGAPRVCALIKDNLEIPSDYHGIMHVEMDSNDGWKLRLFRELKHAGLAADFSRI